MANEVKEKMSKLEEFKAEVVQEKSLISHLVEKDKLIRWLCGYFSVLVYERIYHSETTNWIESKDDFEDKFVSKLYLDQYGKRYAKYKVYHPDFEFALEVFKHYDDIDAEGNFDLIIALRPGQVLPGELN